MTIVTVDDRAEIERVRREIREDRMASIVIRRDDTILAAQSVRVARLSSHGNYRGEASQEKRAGMVVCGEPDVDVMIGDRFTLEGSVYRILFIRPNRETGTQAEVELVQ